MLYHSKLPLQSVFGRYQVVTSCFLAVTFRDITLDVVNNHLIARTISLPFFKILNFISFGICDPKNFSKFLNVTRIITTNLLSWNGQCKDIKKYQKLYFQIKIP
jgi:hypothetical protein